VAQLAFCCDRFGMTSQRIAMPRHVCLLVAARGVRRQSPSRAELVCESGPPIRRSAHFRHGSGRKLTGPIALTKPSGPPSWLAPLPTARDQRVVTDAGRLEKRNQPRQMLVGWSEHAGKRRCSRVHALLAALCPSTPHAIVAPGILVSGGTMPSAFRRAIRAPADVPAIATSRHSVG